MMPFSAPVVPVTVGGPGDDDDLGPLVGVAFASALVPMLLINDSGEVREANEAAVQRLGTRDLVGRSLTDLHLAVQDPYLPQRVPARPGRTAPVVSRVDEILTASGQRIRLLQLSERTDAERDLDLGGGWLRQMADSLPDTGVMLYDRDLRVIAAGGPAWDRAGLDVDVIVGRQLSEVFSHSAFVELEQYLVATFQHREAQVDYVSPRSRLEYQLTCRPILGTDGTVLAGLMVSQELTEERARRNQFEEIQRLSHIGSACFDRVHGWSVDDELLVLLGVDGIDQVMTALDTVVLPDDRSAVRQAYASVMAEGGRATVRYRIRDGRNGQLRHIIGGIMAVLDTRGELLRAIVTHADVTAAVTGEQLLAKASYDRTLLLRRVSDMLAQRVSSQQTSLQNTIDVAAAAFGRGTLVRVVTLANGDVDLDLLSAPDDPHADPIPESIHQSVQAWIPPASAIDPDKPSARLYSSIDNPEWRTSYQQQTGRAIHVDIAHFISAPIRHDGAVFGFVRAFRLDELHRFQSGDDDLLQVIADRVGAVLAADRVLVLLEKQYDEGRTLADRLRELTTEQRELLEQLSRVEERERLVLAEAIHDDPLQLIVASLMRLDSMAIDLDSYSEDFNAVIEMLEDAVQKLRTLITALTPPELDEGLGLALKRLADAVFVVDKSVTVQVTGRDHVSLSALQKMNACRILREGLVNARKHAKARHIWLDLAEQNGTVTATLRDDGVGAVSLDAGHGHLGMATMRARAADEGGHLEVRTAQGEGTTLILTLQVHPTEGLPPGPAQRV